jgi:type I restriction enzyme, S subunit
VPDESEDDALPSDPLPPGWRWARLQQLAAHERNSMTDGPFGSKLKTSDYVEQGVRVIRLGNLGVGEFKDGDQAYITPEKFETLRRHEVFAGDLVIAALAEPVGRAVEVPPAAVPAIVKADCVRLKVHPEISTRYVMYALNSPGGRQRAEAKSHGIGRLRINMANMRALPVPLAPSNEQRRIVAKIEALFARSRRAKEAVDAIPPLLDRLRQSILAAAFRGDLTADWRAQHPDVEPADKLLERIRTERRRRWEEAQLARMRAKGKQPRHDNWRSKYKDSDPLQLPQDGEFPSSWSYVVLETLCTHIVDCLHSTPSYSEAGVPAIRTADVANGRLLLASARLVDEATYKERVVRLEPKEGDVLYTREGERFGLAALVPPNTKMCLAQRMMHFRTCEGVDGRYFMWMLNSPQLYRQAELDVGGSTSPHVNIGSIRRFSAILPPFEEQLVIAEKVDSALAAVDRLEASLSASMARLSRLDASILSRAFTGHLVGQDTSDDPAAAVLKRLVDSAAIRAAPAVWKRRPVREGGRDRGARAIYKEIDAALTNVMAAGVVDRPSNGVDRSVLPDAGAFSREHWRTCLLAAVDGEALEREEAIRLAAEWARDNLGLKFKRLPSDGRIVKGLKSAMNSAIRRGELERVGSDKVRRVELWAAPPTMGEKT